MTIDNRTKKLISFFVSSILVSGNVMAMNSWKKFKADYATKNKPNANNLKPAYIIASGAGLLSVAGITGLALCNKNDSSSSSSSSSSSTRASSPTSNSPSSTRFIPQTFTRPSPSNKLDSNMENECQHTIELYKNVFCSVWKGNILTVRPKTYKEGDKIAVMVPDNEFLKPTDGSLAEAIALTLLGKKEYEYSSDSSLQQKFKTGGAAVGTDKNDITLVHVRVPKRPENMTNTVTKMEDSSPVDSLRAAYVNGFLESVLCLSEESNGKYRIINLPLLGDGSAGWTTDETLICLSEALERVSGEAKKYIEGEYLKGPIYINIVIYPKYNTTKDSKTKTDMVEAMLEELKENNAKSTGKTISLENKEEIVEITAKTKEKIKEEPKEETKEETKEENKEEIKEENTDEPKEETIDEPKKENKEKPIDESKTEITKGNIEENKEENKEKIDDEITEGNIDENKKKKIFIERSHPVTEGSLLEKHN